MKKSKKIKLAGVLLGAALSSTGAYAGNGSCGAGKCGSSSDKKVEKKGSCGAGKCGSSDKMDKSKMSDDKMKSEGMDEMSGDSGKKTDMTCGAGKCGSNMN